MDERNNFQSFHSSYEDKKKKYSEDEEMLGLWLLFKDMEKNLTKFFGRMVFIQEYNISFLIKGVTVIMCCSENDFRRGVCKMKIGRDEFIMPQEKYKFLCKLKDIPFPTENIDIPERVVSSVYKEQFSEECGGKLTNKNKVYNEHAVNKVYDEQPKRKEYVKIFGEIVELGH